MAPYFSIILPVYNVAPYLQRCVDSVLQQSFQDYEIILVNDGSTDGSKDLCDALSEKYKQIRVIHKENGGLASARNAGLEAAAGMYIWWVDSDDWIEANALQILQMALEECSADIVKFNHFRIEAADTRAVLSNCVPGCYQSNQELEALREQAFFAAGSFCLSACTHVYRRDFLQSYKLSFVSERVVGSEDYLFNLQALLHVEKVRVLKDVLYSYEQRQGSLTQSYKKDLLQRFEVLREKLKDYYRSAGQIEQYEGKIDRLFVWHLIRGSCIVYEYSPSDGHTVAQGRKNLCALFSAPSVQDAIVHCDRSGLNGRQRLQLWAMEQGLESLFYWLYVIKPNIKRRFRR